MAKELPFFRFTVSEWLSDDINFEDYYLKGLFIDICSFYWFRDCQMPKVLLLKKFPDQVKNIEKLVELNILKFDEENNVFFINFLDKQYKILFKSHKNSVLAGKKGGKQKAINAKAMPEEKPTYKYNNNDNNNNNNNKTLFPEINKDLETKKQKHLFEKSPLFDYKLFEKVFIQEMEVGINILYYYNAIKTWSAQGNKKLKWKATAQGFMNRDKADGKLKMIKSEKEEQKNKELAKNNLTIDR